MKPDQRYTCLYTYCYLLNLTYIHIVWYNYAKQPQIDYLLISGFLRNRLVWCSVGSSIWTWCWDGVYANGSKGFSRLGLGYFRELMIYQLRRLMYIFYPATSRVNIIDIIFFISEARQPDMYDTDVMILASGNFERELKRAYMIFVFFYKDKCEKCQKVSSNFTFILSYIYWHFDLLRRDQSLENQLQPSTKR